MFGQVQMHGLVFYMKESSAHMGVVSTNQLFCNSVFAVCFPQNTFKIPLKFSRGQRIDLTCLIGTHT